MKIKVILIILILFQFKNVVFADEKESAIYNYAIKLSKDGKNEEALNIFKNLLKTDSTNIQYLCRTSVLYSTLGVSIENEKNKLSWFNTASYLSKKAIKIDMNSADAHLAYAIALGRLNENANTKTQINNAKLIKQEAETVIKLNPKLASAYHILGRWHQRVAGFSSIERGMIKMLFGGMPGGTYDDAIKNFEFAILLEPLYALHYLELAKSFISRNGVNDKSNAKTFLLKAVQIQSRNKEENKTKLECESLLKKLNS